MPQSVSLVLVDLLVDYFDASLWPESDVVALRDTLAERTNDLIRICREVDIPVLWVRQAFREDLSDAFPHMRRSGRKYTIRGTPGAEILPELDHRESDIDVFKTRYSAFFQTDLDLHLRELGTRTVVLGGITTPWCIRSTAVDAYQLDYDVWLAKECLAGFRTQDHIESLHAMDGYLGPALLNSEIAERLTPPGPP